MNYAEYMGETYCLTARSAEKLSEDARAFIDAADARKAGLPEDIRELFGNQFWNCDLLNHLHDSLLAGEKPSSFFAKKLSKVCGTCILPRWWDAFMWAIDACRDRPYPQGVFRRPFRSDHYATYTYMIAGIARRFAYRAIVDADLVDILSGKLPSKALAYTKESGAGYTAELIAYELNQGNNRLKDLLTACLNGDEGAPQANRTIFLGIQLSGCTELQILLGKLLLAARLQEGLRQSICEVADEGTIPAFRTILGVIADNDLLRYSSVRRAVDVWTGLGSDDLKDLKRVSDKTLRLLLKGLDSDANRTDMLRSDDSMEIYMGLWAEAIGNVRGAVRLAEDLVQRGTRHQAAVCCFFGSVIQEQDAYLHLAKAALTRFPDEPEILALCLQAFLAAAGSGLDAGYRVRMSTTFVPADVKWYAPMQAWYQKLRGKEQTVQTDVFPWLAPVIRKADLALILCGLAIASGDERLQDKALALLPQVTADLSHRTHCMKALLIPIRRPAQKATLMAALADKSADTRMAAFEIADKLPPQELDFPVIEAHLKLKASDLRTNCLKLLVRQEDQALTETIRRLLADPLPQKRAAGYDLILQIAAGPKHQHLKPTCAEMLPLSEPQDAQERLLWESAAKAVKPEAGAQHLTGSLFDDTDRYEPDLSFIEKDPVYREAFLRLFPDSVAAGKGPGMIGKPRKAFRKEDDCPSCAEARRDLQSLLELIDAHKEDPIHKNPFNDEEQLLGYGHLMLPVWYIRNQEAFPYAELWENWYARLGGPERLARVVLLLLANASIYETLVDDNAKNLPDELFGTGFQRASASPYAENAKAICAYLLMAHDNAQELAKAGMWTAHWLIQRVPSAQFAWAVKEARYSGGAAYRQGIGAQCVTGQAQISWMLSFLLRVSERSWAGAYALREALFLRYQRQRDRILVENSEAAESVPRYSTNLIYFGAIHTLFSSRRDERMQPVVLDDLKAVRAGIITDRVLYARLFQPGCLRGGLTVLSQASLYIRTRNGETSGTLGRGFSRFYAARECLDAVELLTGKRDGFTEEDMALLRDADQRYLTVMPIILESELRRGDTMAEWSQAIGGIHYIRGVEWLGRILAALGKTPLQRGLYGIRYHQEIGRVESFCHLLSVSIPAAGDDEKALTDMIRQYGIREQRLIEVAMYNTAWVPLIGEHLAWPGFASAVYFFIAHMNETFDEERKAVIARFTPLAADELNAGAFDIDWFRRVWDEAGEKRFGMLYDAAKYITDNTRHTRARKYADAVLGRLNPDETEKEVLEKRNKDLLMAYALIPLSGDEDLLRRFLFIQRYIKDSRQFGAQRSAAERRAGEMALVNLATNSGDRDVIRLTLRMEGRMAENSLTLFEPIAVDDVTVRLDSDPAGNVSLQCEIDGKELKSVPARLKKHPEIQRLTEAKKQLTEQARRCCRFLEEAMTDGIELTCEEIRRLRVNQGLRPMVDSLVVMTETDSFGLPCDEGLMLADGSVTPWADCASLRIAHPFHLYCSGVWPAWQKYIFSQRIKQPFKQVFRELYVKTEDEAGSDHTLRYAGHQVQPRKAVAALRTRRWSASTEEGLQKVFYRDNLIAILEAKADWFTPSDIEAPTLESIRFFDRLSGQTVPIGKVPEVLFSEVMRDVDLAVSVAFVGGVDPEASHSTIEMRAALLEFVLPMFGITNVRIDRRHAIIQGKLSTYTVHLGSGIVHQQGGAMLQITAVHSQQRGKLFLPFADDDPQTAEILTKVLFLAEDSRIRDPKILEQIR